MQLHAQPVEPAPALTPDHAALAPLHAAGFGGAQIERVLAFYDEPHRRYHDRVHLREMFDTASLMPEPLATAQALAILFHDAIYVPGAARGSNEMMSAQLLRVYAGFLPGPVVEAACAIVLDTAEHVARNAAAEVVLDLDLLRLAVDEASFEVYSRQVFDEQRPLIMIADDDAAWRFFSQRRRPFFERLLARHAIYGLPWFYDRFEAIARRNLEHALALTP